MPLGELLHEMLTLQIDRVSDPQSPVMRRRREVVEREIPQWMRQERLPYPEWRTEGSSGKGGPAEIPWSRCYDPELSPKAGVGWYIVYLFASDGSAVYLSLNQGTTTWDTSRKDFVFKSPDDLRSRVSWARSVLRSSGHSANLVLSIDLRARGRLGRAYQTGNVFAVEYKLDEILSETRLQTDFLEMTARLADLYEADLEPAEFAGHEAPEVEEVVDAEDEIHATDSAEVVVEAPQASAVFGTAVGGEVHFEAPAAAEIGAPTASSGLLIAAIADDDTTGPDRLGVARDARALAGLMISRELKPPLAVAVYGEWGSGKTFFMRQIEANISRLASGDAPLFEAAVRHIHFGAWHYARGNLWASLLAHIFSTLCPPASSTDQMMAEATAKIDSIQSTLASASARIVAIEERVEQIDEEIEETEERHKEILESLKSVRGKDIWANVSANDELRKEFEDAVKDLGIPVAVTGTRELFDAAREVAALASRARFLATARDNKKRWSFITSPLGAAIVVGIVGLALMCAIALVAPAGARTIGTYIVSFGTIGSGAAAWIRNQAANARRILEPAERLQRQIEQRVEDERVAQAANIADLEAKAAKAHSELRDAREHRARTADELDAALQAKDELSPGRLLERYLAERVASGEYDQHLGVVGVVHRDLLNLSNHLEAAVADPSSSTKRIVLYIDDLDRCAPNTVVEVLEAVHLLLALPLFVVVVGINRRILDRSLRAHQPELIESDEDAPTSADYLEKIFQLSYTLPPMSIDGCRAVLRAAAGKVGFELDEPDSAGSEAVVGTNSTASTDPEVPTGVGESDSELLMIVDEPNHLSDVDLAKALSLRQSDLDVLDLVAPLVTATPRRAKRFLSVYLVVRARYADADLDAVALALAVALLIGLPRSVGEALRQCDMATTEDTLIGYWITDLASRADGTESRQITAFVESAGDLLELPLLKVVDQVRFVIAYT